MTNLRKEIKEILPFINGFKDGEFYSEEKGIEDILKLIEKGIDVLFQQLKQKDIDSKTRGYLDCLDDVKELVK